MQEQIRVGIVGANAKKSWASVSHVPAIKGLAGLKLVAVATRNEQSAREATEAFGADRWFSDPMTFAEKKTPHLTQFFSALLGPSGLREYQS